MDSIPLITLTTDYGYSDIYAGVLKGVILGIYPACRIIDITHDIAPQDIQSGCRALESACPYFPEGTIHLGVVDPGVGGSRRGIVIETDRYFCVGPDNGLFTFALTSPGLRCAWELTESGYFLPGQSATFHGRDIFAPAAAHMARGVRPEQLGPRLHDPVLLAAELPVVHEGWLEGSIVHKDRFGNLITSIRREMLEGFIQGQCVYAECGHAVITELAPCYAAARDELFCILNSSGRLEISVKNGNAAQRLHASPGQGIRLRKLQA